MNIGSFLHRDQALYGVFNGETVAPASPGLIAQYPTLRDLLDAEKSEALKGSVNLSATIPIAEITFQPPIPNPRKIICVGMNYPKPYPVDGVAPPSPEHIILFGKESETLVGHGATLEVPRGTPADSFDYEGEIAVVIGKTARHVTPVQAMDHVLGYAPFNDGSVREWQKHSIYAGKNFANSGSWGPWIATADDAAACRGFAPHCHLERGNVAICIWARDDFLTARTDRLCLIIVYFVSGRCNRHRIAGWYRRQSGSQEVFEST